MEAEPASDARAATPFSISDVDVTKNVKIADLDKGRGALSIPPSVQPSDGPLGKELPYRIDTTGYRAQMKNVRPGQELLLTMNLRKPEQVYPQIEVFLKENCIGILEVFRAELFAPAVTLAETYGVNLTMGGITETHRGRVEPFIYLPNPQVLFNTLKEGIETARNTHDNNPAG
ncbi:hypothetical protein [Arthrobacter sunyaminii]|uniref:Uncharacterized protein n=1 Tax=Arthrobacter sunyaminii TaxID=2816859 RepID=A0A975XLY3_9MICC|nr:hypothetical protein [Arthrobacter sunyaminii]MBO0910125.1 hypothetical protein [Arthrobacter sunyaminii]QWQ37401.1 hypothetical protein KG104_06595 [Arthrobacter sunyaminii]